jgi:hypothetical protein
LPCCFKINLIRIPSQWQAAILGIKPLQKWYTCDPENPLESRLFYDLHAILFCGMFAAASVFGGQ